MNGFDGRRAGEDRIPSVQEFEGFGELTVGGSVAGGDVNRLVFTALAMLNHPLINSFLLANKVKMSDRITKTRIFPRPGMSLLDGVYEEEVLPQGSIVLEQQENE